MNKSLFELLNESNGMSNMTDPNNITEGFDELTLSKTACDILRSIGRTSSATEYLVKDLSRGRDQLDMYIKSTEASLAVLKQILDQLDALESEAAGDAMVQKVHNYIVGGE